VQQGGGLPKKRRYFVQIDGQDFEAKDEQDALRILQQAAALAERAAEKAVQAKPAQSTTKVAPVRVAVPEVRTNAPVDVAPYRRAIKQAYRNAAVAAELRMLLEAQARDEEEAAIYLLLH
jgi:hypothetical protein